jgi:hypothetical protein
MNGAEKVFKKIWRFIARDSRRSGKVISQPQRQKGPSELYYDGLQRTEKVLDYNREPISVQKPAR